ncbi:helix-turn-helix domain-containing protein [Streptomyces sp. NPDC026672]|uniref:PucR family transcriptional regulator n=1 Tax=unclassified Streptomyces TaxID=2593676 RepID=UPI0033E4BFAD
MTTLEELARRLGAGVVLMTPTSAAETYSGVALWEGASGTDCTPGTLLFAACAAGDGEREDVLGTARRTRCAAVVVREPARPQGHAEWADAAQRHGVPLLFLRGATPWLTAINTAMDVTRSGPAGAAGTSDTASDIPLGDLFALADSFADRTGGPVIIEDSNFRVLAYSSFIGSMDRGRDTAILGRRIPPEWLEYLERTGSLERLRSTSDVVDLDSGPGRAHRRLITAVRSGSQLLGIMWVAEGDHPLPRDASEALRGAAELAVPHLLRHQEGHKAERLWRGSLVRSLLDGRGQLHRYADELGLPRNAALAVMAFAPAVHEALAEEVWDRITDHVSLACEAYRWQAAVSRVGHTVFAILAVPGGTVDHGVTRLGQEVVNRSVPVLPGRLLGAVSAVEPGLGRLNQRRVEAENGLNVLRDDAGPAARFVRYEEVQAQVILGEVRQTLAQRSELRLPGLECLASEDRARGTDHVGTLGAYLRAGGNAGEAARAVGVHVTTLRYRMDRIKKISGLDLDDPAVRLVCELLLSGPLDR